MSPLAAEVQEREVALGHRSCAGSDRSIARPDRPLVDTCHRLLSDKCPLTSAEGTARRRQARAAEAAIGRLLPAPAVRGTRSLSHSAAESTSSTDLIKRPRPRTSRNTTRSIEDESAGVSFDQLSLKSGQITGRDGGWLYFQLIAATSHSVKQLDGEGRVELGANRVDQNIERARSHLFVFPPDAFG